MNVKGIILSMHALSSSVCNCFKQSLTATAERKLISNLEHGVVTLRELHRNNKRANEFSSVKAI